MGLDGLSMGIYVRSVPGASPETRGGEDRMLRVKAGQYRDVYRGRVYDVFRDRLPLGGRMASGWRYQLLGGKWSELYKQKERAAFYARREISEALDSSSATEA